MLRHHVLFDERTIGARVQELAQAIRGDLPQHDLVVVGLLTGSFIFVADLVRAAARLGVEAWIDFMVTSHYAHTTAPTGPVEVLRDITIDVRNRPVLLVDDILDTGLTLQHARAHLAARGAAWLRTCVLLDKPMRRLARIEADYVGFEVPDCWVIGYGLDLAGQGRSLPYIGALDLEAQDEPEHRER